MGGINLSLKANPCTGRPWPTSVVEPKKKKKKHVQYYILSNANNLPKGCTIQQGPAWLLSSSHSLSFFFSLLYRNPLCFNFFGNILYFYIKNTIKIAQKRLISWYLTVSRFFNFSRFTSCSNHNTMAARCGEDTHPKIRPHQNFIMRAAVARPSH